MFPIHKMVATSWLALLAGCGGSPGDSSGSGDNTSAAVAGVGAASVPVVLDGPPRGFIVVEERAGKYVFDGWFSRAEVPLRKASLVWQEGSQHCESLDATVAPWRSAQATTGQDSLKLAGTQWRQTLFAGESIDITSRTGIVISLRAERYGTAVLYTSDERWLDKPLPDDARLDIPGSDVFPAFPGIAMVPLLPLVRVQPADGVASTLALPIEWEASADSDDGIELTIMQTLVNQPDAQGSSGQWVNSVPQADEVAATRTIRCSLADSGRFILPQLVRNTLSDVVDSVVSLVRKREVTYNQGEAALSIVQLSYP